MAVVLEPGPPPHAMLVALTGEKLGPIAGVAQLARFIECLREGVAYKAHVEKVTEAALTCTILQANG